MEKFKSYIFYVSIIIFLIFCGYRIFQQQYDGLLIHEIEVSYLSQDVISERMKLKINKKLEGEKTFDADDYFLKGYLISLENEEEAIPYFEEVITHQNEKSSHFASLYSYKILSEHLIKQGDSKQALEYIELAFNKINSKEYNHYSTYILELIRPALQVADGRTLTIELFNDILLQSNLYHDKNAKLLALRNLEYLYIVTSNYVNAIETSIETISLADELGDYYFKGKSIVNLANLARHFNRYEESLELLRTVKNIELDDPEKADKLNVYRLFSAIQIEMFYKNYENILPLVNELNEYTAHLSVDDKIDVEIVQEIVLTELTWLEGNALEGTKHLDKIVKLMEQDNSHLVLDKDIYYLYLRGRNEGLIGNDEIEEQYLLEAEQLSVQRGNLETLLYCVDGFISLYEKRNDVQKVDAYQALKIKIKEKQKAFMDKEYYTYLTDKIHLNKIKSENDKIRNNNLILTLFTLIVSVLIFNINISPLVKKRRLKAKVRQYLHRNEYLPFYQPIINPKTDKIIGFEALLRLKLNDKLIMPFVIISEIEHCEMMGEVTLWLLQKVIRDYPQFDGMKQLKDDYYISINLSAREIEDDEFVNSIIKLIAQSNLKRYSVCLEIVESRSGQQEEKMRENIRLLREAGYLIAIDDFGVEHSNISILEKFEFDILKLDKCMIDNIHQSHINQVIIDTCDYVSVISNKTIVMEGVEEINQAERIKQTKSETFYIQGYYYSKPMELKELVKLDLFK